MLCGLAARSGSITAARRLERLRSRGKATAAARPLCRQLHVRAAAAADGDGAEQAKSQVALPYIIETKNVPIYLYTQPDELEEVAMKQLIRVAETAMPVGYVAAMPDVHWGQGVTIGTVFASEKYVCPNAVGVDIGCGMCAVPIDGLHKDDLTLGQKVQIQQLIKERIPVGFNAHEVVSQRAREVIDEISHKRAPSTHMIQMAMGTNTAKQLGTLGGGNHFLEVVHDETGRVWIMLHSGSRKVGLTTAQLYDRKAQLWLEEQGVTATAGLNYLPIDSEQGQGYLNDMSWCQDYAFQNRAAMLDSMIECVNEVTGATPDISKAVNIWHNYCSCERCKFTDPHTGEKVDRNLWVTRKGATSAKAGELGIIPGSMGVGSFITRGRGNSQSWSSCSHGAGRRLSRTAAKATIKQEDFEKSMVGIVCDTDEAVRDEAPQAYKDLTKVMVNQADLTDVVHRLQPLINVKGFADNSKGSPSRQRWKKYTKPSKQGKQQPAAAAAPVSD